MSDNEDNVDKNPRPLKNPQMYIMPVKILLQFCVADGTILRHMTR